MMTSKATSRKPNEVLKGEKKVITPSERLFRRIDREFGKKRFIGDIIINDSEFEILLEYFKIKTDALMTSYLRVLDDRIYATALVQIGIRFYDGNFWGHVASLLGLKNIDAARQSIIGESFIRTLISNKKLVLDRSERVHNILMHGFVSDLYAYEMFDFLFKYYNIDLERDLQRNTAEMMNSLIDTITRNDNTGRTYMLVKQTANAIRSNIRGGKVRIRWLLRLIDKSFWEQVTPSNPVSRLSILFNRWQENSEEFRVQYNRYNCSQNGGGQKSFSSPYLRCDLLKTVFSIELPSQLIKFENSGPIQWKVLWKGLCRTVQTTLYQEGVTGLKTEPVEITIDREDIFNEFIFELYSNGERIRLFKIKSDIIRFFDSGGFNINVDGNTSQGEVVAFTRANEIPHSEALVENETIGCLLRSSFQFEYGDIVRLPDGKPLSIGKKIEEGLLNRKSISDAFVLCDDVKIPVYSAPPAIFIKINEKRAIGAMIEINGERHRFFDTDTTVIDLFDRHDEKGYVFNLRNIGCERDGIYSIYIDVPNDRTDRQWTFALVNGLKYRFEEAPYILRTKGTIQFDDFPMRLKPRDSSLQKNLDDNSYNFTIMPEKDVLRFTYISQSGNLEIGFEIPAFKWKYAGSEWNVEKPAEIWHNNFPSMIYVKFPDDRMRISLEEQLEDIGREHSVSYTKINSKGIFECDVTRFKSWLGRDKVARTLYIDFPKNRVEFITVITRSYVSAHIIKSDFLTGRLVGEISIIGLSNYYADVIYLKKNELIGEKIPISNGFFSIENKFSTGEYKVVVYEEENDDSGFFGTEYLPIGSFKQQLINPYDLRGRSIELKYLKKGMESIFQINFGCKYIVNNLQRLNSKDNENYRGTLVISRLNGPSPISYSVHVHFIDLEKLQYVELSYFDEEDESLEFLYDYSRKIIVKKEEVGLTWSVRYRRYECIFPGDYVYVIAFTDTIEASKALPNNGMPRGGFQPIRRVKKIKIK